MADYQLSPFDQIIRTSDGAIIPKDERNADYQDFLVWSKKKGNKPDPVDADLQKRIDNDEVMQKIRALESSVTSRMRDDALLDSTDVFPNGTKYAGKTAKEAIAAIRAEIATLREQLV